MRNHCLIQKPNGVEKKMNNRFGSKGGSFDSDREMFDAVCSDCQKTTKVPFKPTEGRAIYCRDCLPKHREPRRF